jgi:hypothetical protein
MRLVQKLQIILIKKQSEKVIHIMGGDKAYT